MCRPRLFLLPLSLPLIFMLSSALVATPSWAGPSRAEKKKSRTTETLQTPAIGPAPLGPSHYRLVLELELLFVQKIPTSVTPSAPSDFISVKIGKAVNNFRVYPYARELFTSLASRKEFELHIFTRLPLAVATEILKQLKTSEPTTRSFSEVVKSVATEEDLTELNEMRFKDLTRYKGNLEDVILLTGFYSDVLQGQEEMMFPLGQANYYFDSFRQADEFAKKTEAKDPAKWPLVSSRYPKTELDWKKDTFRLARLATAFDDSRGKVENLKNILSQVWAEDPAITLQVGQEKLTGSWKPETYEWKVEDAEDAVKAKVSGCTQIDGRTRQIAKTVSLDVCSKKLPIKHYLKGTKSDDCWSYTNNAVPIAAVSLEKCSALHWVVTSKGEALEVSHFDGIEKLTADEAVHYFQYDGRASFRRLLLDPKSHSSLRIKLGENCADAVIELFNQGKSLSNDSLRQAIYPISKFTYASGILDTIFYHYTNSDGLPKLLETDEKDREKSHSRALADHRYDEIFSFIRNRESSYWFKNFYLAEDPNSSTGYGKYGLAFQLDPQASGVTVTEQLITAAKDETFRKYPQLKETCTFGWNKQDIGAIGCIGIHFDGAPLFMIILEESGIDLVHYCSAPNFQWFQLTSPRSIKKTWLHKVLF